MLESCDGSTTFDVELDASGFGMLSMIAGISQEKATGDCCMPRLFVGLSCPEHPHSDEIEGRCFRCEMDAEREAEAG